MAGVAGIAWLRERDIGVVNRKGSSAIWSLDPILTLHWDKGELEQPDGGGQVGFEWLSILTKRTIRTFYLAEKRKSDFVQLQKGTQRKQYQE